MASNGIAPLTTTIAATEGIPALNSADITIIPVSTSAADNIDLLHRFVRGVYRRDI